MLTGTTLLFPTVAILSPEVVSLLANSWQLHGCSLEKTLLPSSEGPEIFPQLTFINFPRWGASIPTWTQSEAGAPGLVNHLSHFVQMEKRHSFRCGSSDLQHRPQTCRSERKQETVSSQTPVEQAEAIQGILGSVTKETANEHLQESQIGHRLEPNWYCKARWVQNPETGTSHPNHRAALFFS